MHSYNSGEPLDTSGAPLEMRNNSYFTAKFTPAAYEYIFSESKFEVCFKFFYFFFFYFFLNLNLKFKFKFKFKFRILIVNLNLNQNHKLYLLNHPLDHLVKKKNWEKKILGIVQIVKIINKPWNKLEFGNYPKFLLFNSNDFLLILTQEIKLMILLTSLFSLLFFFSLSFK